MKKKYYDSETMILMHDGTIKKVQDIKKNNIVMSVDGKGNIVKNVLNDTNEMYNIIPTRGESYTVAKNHTLILKASNYEMIWWQESRKRYRIRWLQNFSIKEKSYSVSTHGSRENAEEKAKKYLKKEVPKLDGYTKYRDIIEIEAKDYYKLSKRVRDVYKGFSVGIDFPEKEVSCDPYLIGMWLGDGDSDSNRITTADKEIVDYLNDYCQKNKLELKKVAKYRYHPSTGAYGGPGRNPFRNSLKQYNLLGNKHIPKNYKLNSRENRLKLLAGLVDSDGSNSNNTYDFCFKSEKLADDTIFVARSLGFSAFKKKTIRTCMNAPGGPKKGTYYRFHIYGKGLEEVPSLLPRKQMHKRQTKKDACVTNLSLKPIKNKEYYELEIEGNTGILLSDFTLT